MQQAPISKTAAEAKYVTFAQSIKSIHGEEGLKSFWRYDFFIYVSHITSY